VQVDPIKPALQPPGTKRLKLEHDEMLSKFTFKSNLRSFNQAELWLGASPDGLIAAPATTGAEAGHGDAATPQVRRRFSVNPKPYPLYPIP